MFSEHPVPTVTPWTEKQFEYAREGVLAVQKCVDGGEVWYPPSSNCPTCLSDKVEWVPVSGKGRLWSWIAIHQPYLPAFKDEIPYVVAAVKLDEGPLLITTLVGVEKDDIVIDSAVESEFAEFGPDALPMPVFRPRP